MSRYWLRPRWPLAALLTLTSVLAVDAADAQQVRLVANASVPTGAVSKKVLQAIFKGEAAQWTDGTPLKPVDQSVRSDVRAAFTREVLNDSIPAIQIHWMRRISQSRGLPPPVKTSDGEVISYVAATRGALGYVSAATPIPAGVKLVTLID